MIPLYTDEQFNASKSREKLPLQCIHCNEIFYKTKHRIQEGLNPNHKSTYMYCSQKCQGLYKTFIGNIKVKCKQCNKEFYKQPSYLSKSGNNFCSRSCAVTYNNTHKTTGTRRSKLEVQLEQQLTSLYTDLEIHFNRKDTIDSELDIYLPSLKLAFELNGIFHYEPIFGDNKLSQIQNNDSNKFMKCQWHNISLCIIDVSSFIHFKELGAKKYLDIITTIIDQHLAS